MVIHDRMIVTVLTSVSTPQSVTTPLSSAMPHEAMHHRVVARGLLGNLPHGSLILVAFAASATTLPPTASGGPASRGRITTVLDHPLVREIREMGGPASYEWRANVGAW